MVLGGGDLAIPWSNFGGDGFGWRGFGDPLGAIVESGTIWKVGALLEGGFGDF
jgi:hypothetical protein